MDKEHFNIVAEAAEKAAESSRRLAEAQVAADEHNSIAAAARQKSAEDIHGLCATLATVLRSLPFGYQMCEGMAENGAVALPEPPARSASPLRAAVHATGLDKAAVLNRFLDMGRRFVRQKGSRRAGGADHRGHLFCVSTALLADAEGMIRLPGKGLNELMKATFPWLVGHTDTANKAIRHMVSMGLMEGMNLKYAKLSPIDESHHRQRIDASVTPEAVLDRVLAVYDLGQNIFDAAGPRGLPLTFLILLCLAVYADAEGVFGGRAESPDVEMGVIEAVGGVKDPGTVRGRLKFLETNRFVKIPIGRDITSVTLTLPDDPADLTAAGVEQGDQPMTNKAPMPLHQPG